ncbi:MAG: metal ABC transporter permease [Bacteroidetes bacterium]|nr:metal ABC transporter permease [Bacteroidota bacterium]
MNDIWILLTAIAVALVCAIPGTFLVLRRMSMVGDAISHAVLPGIVIAFMISGSRNSMVMLPGAAAAGMFVAMTIEWLQKKLKVRNDAAIGLVYTLLFAVGVIMVSAFTAQTDLDQDCVLYGEIAYVPFDLFFISDEVFLPRQLLISSTLLILMLFVLVRGYRGLYLSTFDPGYAMSIGVSVAFWHYVLMGMVSLATVVSFESVGAILVVALLSGPAASAEKKKKSLKRMILLAALFGIAAAILGYFIAMWLNASIAGSIAMCTGVVYFLSLLVKKLLKPA